MRQKFKVGQSVLCIYPRDGNLSVVNKIGIIFEIDEDCISVEFKDINIQGHDGREYPYWNLLSSDLKIIETPVKRFGICEFVEKYYEKEKK
jgi:hypothetical protein